MMRPARSVTPSVLSEADDDRSSYTPSTSEIPFMVWSGDKHVDWLHARQVLKDLPTDGRRIAMWRQWLSQSHRSPEMSEANNEFLSASSALWSRELPSALGSHDRTCAKAVLEAYMSEVLSFFVFPDSRHSFMDMLASMQIVANAIDLDFYSLHRSTANLESSIALAGL